VLDHAHPGVGRVGDAGEEGPFRLAVAAAELGVTPVGVAFGDLGRGEEELGPGAGQAGVVGRKGGRAGAADDAVMDQRLAEMAVDAGAQGRIA
jgi:hypothetical protein